jgi:hypothetical protein
VPNPGDERKSLAPPPPRLRRQGPLDAGPFAADVASFELHLAAENKSAGTIRIYTEAPRWFASAYLLPETDKTRWEQVNTQELNGWSSPQMLARYGASARSARAQRTYDRIMTDNPYPPRASDSPLPPCAIAQRTPARDPPNCSCAATLVVEGVAANVLERAI